VGLQNALKGILSQRIVSGCNNLPNIVPSKLVTGSIFNGQKIAVRRRGMVSLSASATARPRHFGHVVGCAQEPYVNRVSMNPAGPISGRYPGKLHR